MLISFSIGRKEWYHCRDSCSEKGKSHRDAIFLNEGPVVVRLMKSPFVCFDLIQCGLISIVDPLFFVQLLSLSSGSSSMMETSSSDSSCLEEITNQLETSSTGSFDFFSVFFFCSESVLGEVKILSIQTSNEFSFDWIEFSVVVLAPDEVQSTAKKRGRPNSTNQNVKKWSTEGKQLETRVWWSETSCLSVTTYSKFTW